MTWHYARGGQQLGPVSDDELKQLARSGQLEPTDKVWRDGMNEWVLAGGVKGLFPPKATPPPLEPSNSPPPLGNAPQGTKFFDQANAISANLGQTLKPEHKNKLLLAYRLVLLAAIIGIFCPWVSASASSSLMGHSSSASISVSGTSTNWGTTSLIVAIGGLIISFIGPEAFLKEKVRIVMACVGAVIAISGIVVLARVDQYVEIGHRYRDDYGNYSTSHVGAEFGLYLMLVCGLIATVVGFLHDWKQHPAVPYLG